MGKNNQGDFLNMLCISDVHGKEYKGLYKYLEKFDVDLVIVAGDITHFGPLNFVEEFFNNCASYGSMVAAIPGNCDPKEVVGKINESAAICVHNNVIEYGNVVIYGFGGSNPTPFDTPGEFDEKTLYNSIKAVMESRDINSVRKPSDSFPYGKIPILVTHAPPKDTKADKTENGSHVGSESVRKIIEEYQPNLNLCGHIHKARTFDMIDNTIIANPGTLEDGHGCLIEVDGDNVIVGFVNLK